MIFFTDTGHNVEHVRWHNGYNKMVRVAKTIEWQGFNATDVWVNGDFFGDLEWHQMNKVSDTLWRIRLRLRPGSYQYHFESKSRVFQVQPPRKIWRVLRVEAPEKVGDSSASSEDDYRQEGVSSTSQRRGRQKTKHYRRLIPSSSRSPSPEKRRSASRSQSRSRSPSKNPNISPSPSPLTSSSQSPSVSWSPESIQSPKKNSGRGSDSNNTPTRPRASRSPSPRMTRSPSESPGRSPSPSMNEDPLKDSNPDDIDDFDGDEDDEDKGGDELSVQKKLQQEFSLIVKEIETKQLSIRKPPVLRSPVSLQSKEHKKVCLQQFFYTLQTLFQESIHPMQEQVAKEMMKKITKSQAEAFQNIKYFDVFTIVPFFKSLGKRSPLIDYSEDFHFWRQPSMIYICVPLICH